MTTLTRATTTSPLPAVSGAFVVARLGRVLFSLALWAVAAAGLGLYVYPHRPALVWGLLGLCWACYRLRRRAVRLFGGR